MGIKSNHENFVHLVGLYTYSMILIGYEDNSSFIILMILCSPNLNYDF